MHLQEECHGKGTATCILSLYTEKSAFSQLFLALVQRASLVQRTHKVFNCTFSALGVQSLQAEQLGA